MIQRDAYLRIRRLISRASEIRTRRRRNVRRPETELLEQRLVLSGTGLQSQYFNSNDLSGSPALTRTDATLNFDWGSQSPDVAVNADNFSARWSGEIESRFTETHTFHLNASDGARLWVNGQLLIDNFDANSVDDASAAIDLIAGRRYDMQLEYREVTGNASVSLEWSSPSTPREVIPASQLFAAERGSLNVERFDGISGGTIVGLTGDADFPDNPDAVSFVNSFEAANNAGNSIGQKISGLLHAPETGAYTFYIAADNHAELWLSNTADRAQSTKIAEVTSAVAAQDFIANTEQRSAVVQLVAGQTYFIEALHADDSGSDHLAVAWSRPGSAAIDIIDGQFLSPTLPTVKLFATRPAVSEGAATPAQLNVLRSGPTNNPLTVQYDVGGTAINGTDYQTLSGTITFAAGEASATIEITPLPDALDEGDETLIVTLRDGAGYDVGLKSERTAHVSLQDNRNVPTGGQSLVTGTALGDFSHFGGSFTTQNVAGVGDVIQAAITNPPASQFSAQLRQTIDSPVSAGDILFAEFDVRSLGGSGQISVIFEDVGTFNKSLSQGLDVTTEWQRVQLPFIAVEDHAVGDANFGFHLGFQIQTLQFADIELLTFGPPQALAPETDFGLNNLAGDTWGSGQTVNVTGQPFDFAYQVETHTVPTQTWHLQAAERNEGPVSNGDTMRFTFYARAVAGADPRARLVVSRVNDSFSTLHAEDIPLTSTWQQHTIDVVADDDFAANGLQAVFNLGYGLQTVEIGGFQWDNLANAANLDELPKQVPAVSYGGRDGDDVWRTDADARIANERQSTVTVNVTDANNLPLDGAVVSLRQNEHAFRFGSAINNFGGRLAPDANETSLKYQSEIKRLFNTVVAENSHKWPQWINDRARALQLTDFAEDNDLFLRGHVVIWPSRNNMPDVIWNEYDTRVTNDGLTSANDWLRTRIETHFDDIIATYRDRITEWDVVNEPWTNHDVMDILGDDIVVDWYQRFRDADPNVALALNDFQIFASNGNNTSHRNDFDGWLTQLRDANLLDVIGEQSHYGETNLTDIDILGQLITDYHTNFSADVAITEFDITTDDEQLAADYLRDYLTMSFSQPGVTEFLHWGFWEGAHFSPPAALYRQDFSIKPSGQVWEDTVFGNWWTDTTGTTRGGSVTTDAFLGSYDVLVQYGGNTYDATVDVDASGNSSVIVNLNDVNVREPINLSRFQNVIADSVHEDNGAEEAIDGIVSLESRWVSADTAGPHWLEVQLQAPYPVGSAQMYLGDGWSNSVADFEVQYHDGNQWQTAASVTGDNSTNQNLVFANPVDTATRYRIYTAADRLHVREFVLLPPNGGEAHPMGTGVNLNLASRYVTEVTSTLGTNYAENLVDGYVSDDSKWEPSETSGTHQIELRFLQRQPVRSLHLYTGNSNGSNRLANFEVEFFHTSGEYRAIPPGSTVSSGSINGGVVTGVTSGEVVINFGWTVSADRIRVSSSDTNIAIREAVVLPPSGGASYPIGTSVEFASPPTTQFTDFGDAWHQLVSRQNGQVLVADENGASQVAAATDDEAKYQILYSYSLDAYRIRAKDSGLALQVENASQQTGAAIVEGGYSAAPHQLWTLEPTDGGYFQFVNVWSGMVLHTDAANPSVVTQQPRDEAANPADNVEWQIEFVEDYFKKGTASRINGKFGGSWWYNWGRGDFPEVPNDQFFAPMQWGPWNQDTLHQRHDDWNDDLKPAYLLGFNEPDSEHQANMTVDRAIEIWPQLEALGVPLLSPSATQNNPGRIWHTEFTDRADALGYRQDYAGMHWYNGPNVDGILNYVDTISNLTHGRDVWITEFSTVDWSGGSGNWSEEQNYNFILEFMYRGDRKANLHKYALFMWAGDQPATPWARSNPRGNTFIGDEIGGELTPYGKAYAGWDGKSDPELETLYIIHNRAAYHRLQNDGTDNVGKASIRLDDTSVQWIVQDAGNDEVFITSPTDGRRLKLDADNIVMSDAGATGWGVRWKIQQDQYGWHNLVHSGSGNYLRLNRTNDGSGAPTSLTLDTVSPGSAGNSSDWWFVKPYQEFGLTFDADTISEDGTATATLTRSLVTATDTVVDLTFDNEAAISIPASVTIPAGQSSVTFTVSGVDDNLVDGTQSAFITADAANHQHGIAAIAVTDNDVAELALTISLDAINENGGTSQATVSRNTHSASDLVVMLSSDDTSEANVPASVTIPAGATSVTFDITGQNDDIEDGNHAVAITATAVDHAIATDTIDVLDDDGLALTLILNATSISEVGGEATATVQREGDTSALLIVSLASDDTDEATVPPSVTIAAGQASATFTVTGVDDGVLDAAATVTFSASAANFDNGTAEVVVEDALNHRMSQLTVTVQDQFGNPLPDATIDVSMTQHGFTFGTQVRHRLFGITQPEFDALNDSQKTGLLESGSGSGLVPTWTDVLNYRNAVYTHFNHIVPTNGMQWVAYNNAGPTHVDTAINLAQAAGFGVTGHAAVWGKDGWPTPNEYRSAANPDPQTFLDALIADRLSSTGILARYSDTGVGPTITDWDVLNEPLHEHYFANTFVNAGLYANSTEFYADVFRRAHAARPDARLAVNDYNIITSNGDSAAQQYRDFVNAVNAELAGEAASIEVIKVQAHTWLSLSKADITRRLDILAESGLPIVISEFDMRDDAGQLNAAQQEATFRNFLEASFEHPNVEAFTMWGFWDPGHWRGNGPLYNADWSFKAEAAPWTDLVEGHWMSEQLDQPVDSNGRWVNDLALFSGTYDITADLNGSTASVSSFDLNADGEVVLTIDVPAPDLIGESFNVVNDQVAEGQATVNFSVANIGTADSGTFETHLVWSPNDVIGDADDVPVVGSEAVIAGLPAGQSQAVELSVQLDRAALFEHSLLMDPAGQPVGSASQDSSRLFLVVDINNAVPESDEANNSGNGHLADSDDISYFPWDIDGNHTVSPRDALRTIRAVGTSSSIHDLSGKGVVTPLDALAVLQRIGYRINEDVILDVPNVTVLLNAPNSLPAFVAPDATDRSLFENANDEEEAFVAVVVEDDNVSTTETFSTTEWLDVI